VWSPPPDLTFQMQYGGRVGSDVTLDRTSGTGPRPLFPSKPAHRGQTQVDTGHLHTGQDTPGDSGSGKGEELSLTL
jgi:hypothetical protein